MVDGYGILAAYTSYVGVAGDVKANGAMNWPGIAFANITDGLSNTLLLGERPPPSSLEAGWWYSMNAPPGAPAGEQGPNGYMSIIGTGSPSCAGPFQYGPGSIDNRCDRFHFWSFHSGGANFAFADGGVRFVSYGSGGVLLALATRAGGEVAGPTD